MCVGACECDRTLFIDRTAGHCIGIIKAKKKVLKMSILLSDRIFLTSSNEMANWFEYTVAIETNSTTTLLFFCHKHLQINSSFLFYSS